MYRYTSAFAQTSASIWPNRIPIKKCLKTTTAIIKTVDKIVENQTNWVAEF